jgi:hypothetical protein
LSIKESDKSHTQYHSDKRRRDGIDPMHEHSPIYNYYDDVEKMLEEMNVETLDDVNLNAVHNGELFSTLDDNTTSQLDENDVRYVLEGDRGTLSNQQPNNDYQDNDDIESVHHDWLLQSDDEFVETLKQSDANVTNELYLNDAIDESIFNFQEQEDDDDVDVEMV